MHPKGLFKASKQIRQEFSGGKTPVRAGKIRTYISWRRTEITWSAARNPERIAA